MEQIDSRIIVGFDESECQYVGVAIFPTTEDRDACLADYAEFQRNWSEQLNWHEEHDEDDMAWFEENQYGAEVLESFAEKHNGVFVWNEWSGESVLVSNRKERKSCSVRKSERH